MTRLESRLYHKTAAFGQTDLNRATPCHCRPHRLPARITDSASLETRFNFFHKPTKGLRANQATPETITHAVDEIFTQPRYRERAQQLSLEFASHDVEAELLSLIEECVRDTVSA